jgi:hypothetical protein
MTTLNLEQGMATDDTRIHPVQSSSCCSNLIKQEPTYMSATLRCNVFLRTLFLAIPPVKFSQRVSSNTRNAHLPYPPSQHHNRSFFPLHHLTHPIGPSIQTLRPSPVLFFQLHMSQLRCTTACTGFLLGFCLGFCWEYLLGFLVFV